MGTVLASGYHGPPVLTLTRALTEWTFDPWMLALVLILAAAYLLGVRRVRGNGHPLRTVPKLYAQSAAHTSSVSWLSRESIPK